MLSAGLIALTNQALRIQRLANPVDISTSTSFSICFIP